MLSRMIRSKGTTRLDPVDAEISHNYSEIQSNLASMSAEVIDRSLPNLVDAIETASSRETTRRFRIGVSFSRQFRPLDYQLDRVYEGDEGGREIESIKEPVSTKHRYLRFTYPPDPSFDACALRGALLAVVEGEIARFAGEAWQAQPEPSEQSWVERFLGRFVG
ncbi:MAG: hypothetical protein R3324_01595 [Halobacteriales archaeon]|nr:hypothetical protein [Halobacteriales archaeon]